jgi:hypothetical protein
VSAEPASAKRDEEVHLHRPREILVAGAQESLRPHPDGTDVVDQHVDLAVLLDSPPDQLRRPVCGR